MPAALPTLFFTTPIASGAGVFALKAVATTLATTAASAALTVGAAALQRARAEKKAAPGGSVGIFSDPSQKIISRQPVPPQRMIVGRALVGGPLFFLESKPPFLYFGVLLAAHRIDGIDEVRVGNRKIFLGQDGKATNAPWVDGSTVYFEASIRNGTDDQVLDPILATDFAGLASSFRQRGIACAVCKMRYFGATAEEHQGFWGIGDPQPLFLVRGARYHDPRRPTSSAADPETWAWGRNPSLIQAWWLTNSHNEQAIEWADIDVETLMRAADADDCPVARLGGEMEPRYACDGVITLNGASAFDVLEDLLTANVGRLVWENGLYKMLPGVWRPPVTTFGDAEGRASITARRARPSQDLLNMVRTVFVAAERDYQLVNGPVWTDPALIAADGREYAATIRLPYTSSQTAAQRIAALFLRQSRLGKTVEQRISIDRINVAAGDTVNVEMAALDYLNGTYQVESATISPDLSEMAVVLEETSQSVFAWDATTDERAFLLAPDSL